MPARELSLLDAVGIGVNGIVGSGIYLLVAPLARAGGGSSVFGVLGCGALCVLIALCFAELSSMYDRSGGPYVYARDAFGNYVGYAVGWLGMATGVLGLAAVSVGFAAALGRFVPAASTARAEIAVLLILVLGAINYAGVKAGARTSTALSVLKIAPLVLVALAGLRFAPHAPLALHPREALSAAFLSVFMMSGFEYTAVPAGEIRDARRNVPLAIVGSIAFASLLYALLQLRCKRRGPRSSPRPPSPPRWPSCSATRRSST
jgi:amino acid transporter